MQTIINISSTCGRSKRASLVPVSTLSLVELAQLNRSVNHLLRVSSLRNVYWLGTKTQLAELAYMLWIYRQLRFPGETYADVYRMLCVCWHAAPSRSVWSLLSKARHGARPLLGWYTWPLHHAGVRQPLMMLVSSVR